MATDIITVTYKVTTPLFCGGARPSTAELRLPSIKGVLRWWWRALAWSRFVGDISKIANAEDELFGSARGGQGKVIMRLIPSNPLSMTKKDDVLKLNGQVVGEGVRYLGYGVMEAFGRKATDSRPSVQAGQLSRACLQAPIDLKIELRARDLDGLARGLLLDAIQAMGLLGGIGAKSRKGYGSLVLLSIAVEGESFWSPPSTATDLTTAIQRLLPPPVMKPLITSNLPPYTALSPQTRVVLVSPDGQSQPLELLDRIGREMVRFRGWGKDGIILDRKLDRETGKAGGVASERNFKGDHDLMEMSPNRRTMHPRRIVFGLPHNYGKPFEKQVAPADDQVDRRASPLLIHIHECGAVPIAVLAILRAQFLPGASNAKVNVGGKQVTIAPDQELWKPLDDLLDRFLDPKKRKEQFGQALEVRS
jgi:CRISPR-associated protein Cmr1